MVTVVNSLSKEEDKLSVGVFQLQMLLLVSLFLIR